MRGSGEMRRRISSHKQKAALALVKRGGCGTGTGSQGGVRGGRETQREDVAGEQSRVGMPNVSRGVRNPLYPIIETRVMGYDLTGPI